MYLYSKYVVGSLVGWYLVGLDALDLFNLKATLHEKLWKKTEERKLALIVD